MFKIRTIGIVLCYVFLLAGCGSDSTSGTSTGPAPTIAGFTPANGLPGTAVTITGENFSTSPSDNTVTFNGITAVVTSSTSTQITATVPSGATTGPITVTVGGISSTSADTFTMNALMGGAVQGDQLSLASTVTTVAGKASRAGSNDGTGTAARFANPAGIATDGTNLYVADALNSTIRKIVIATGTVSTIAGSAGSYGSNDGIGTAATFSLPYGITTDGTNLYVADSQNRKIRKIVIASGMVSTLAGSGTSGSADGTGTSATFSYPRGITTDGTNLYVADSGGNTIRKIEIATGIVTTIAGSAGVSGSADGVGTAARLSGPYGITTDGTNLYVADSGNNTIRKIEIATGVVTTIAGTPLSPGSTDGTGSTARFYRPLGITTDGASLYVSDSNNYTIRKVVIATGTVTTLAGSVGTFGSTDGTGAAAKFNLPCGITTDGTSLYVADYNNDTIRRIQ